MVGTIERVLGGSDLTALLRGAADPWTDAVHSYADFAVLYRTDAQSAALVDALEAAGVPYQKRSHHRLGDQPGVRELLGVLREDLVRAAGDPRPVLARVRAAAQVAIDRAGGLARSAVGADEWSQLTPATARAAAARPGRRRPGRRVAELQAAVELLGPLAERAGADAGTVPGRARPRRRGGPVGPAGGPGQPAHPARRQGPGVPGGVRGRLRGRAAADAVRRRAGRPGRGAPAAVRRDDQGPHPPRAVRGPPPYGPAAG